MGILTSLTLAAVASAGFHACVYGRRVVDSHVVCGSAVWYACGAYLDFCGTWTILSYAAASAWVGSLLNTVRNFIVERNELIAAQTSLLKQSIDSIMTALDGHDAVVVTMVDSASARPFRTMIVRKSQEPPTMDEMLLIASGVASAQMSILASASGVSATKEVKEERKETVE